MSDVTLESVPASAFRARRHVGWTLLKLKSRYGELPRHALPGRVPATDSAVAPSRPARKAARPPGPPRPDPEYEKRLEQLAQSMLAASPTPTPAAPEASPPAPVQAAKRERETTRTATTAETAFRPRRERSASSEPSAPTRRPDGIAPPRRAAVPERDSIGRREPWLDPDAMPAGAPSPEGKPRSRKSAVALALLAGLTLGLSAAWWFGELDAMDRALSNTIASSGNSGTRGEDASEAPPAAIDVARPAPDEVSGPVVVTPAPQPAAPQAAAQQDVAPAAEAPEPEPPPAAPSSRQARPAKPPVATVDARKRKDSAREQRRAKASSTAQVASARNSKKPGTAPPRDNEIDRLKSQAYSESSRDRDRKVLPSPRPPGTESAVAVTPISTASAESRLSHKKELAQCEKLDGLFYRERCKWRICKDEWGSNGCPSYPQPQGVRF